MATVIADWHRCEFQLRMRKAGLKPRRVPLSPPLSVLPCNLMVLSGVMLLMSWVGLLPVTPLVPPITWVEALGGVRGLHTSLHFLPTKRKPPDPMDDDDVSVASSLDDSSVGSGVTTPSACPTVETVAEHEFFDPALDGEGDCGCCGVNQPQCHVSNDTIPCCEFISTDYPTPVEPIDLSEHVSSTWLSTALCFLCNWPASFGTLGLLAHTGPESFAIVDTGASMCVTSNRDDFLTYTDATGRVLHGLTKGVAIKGSGIVNWKIEINGKVIELKLQALHVPECDTRLLSPQQLRQNYPSKITLMDIEDECVRMTFPEGDFVCPYNDSNLPIMKLVPATDNEVDVLALNACVMAENNQNLSPSQKELLKWHCKFGHLDLKATQAILKSGAVGRSPLVMAASRLDLTKLPIVCASCAYAKAKRRSSRSKRTKADYSAPPLEKLLSKDVLRPGQKVSMDHFIVSTPGRLFSSRGSEPDDRMYKGGVLFKDHATDYIHAEPVVNFTAGEAIRAKKAFEQVMSSYGVTVLHYHTDNGVFTAAEFHKELADNKQGLTLSGVGAHHQNAMAERSIGVLFNMARTMMLHAKLRWPKAVTAKLWPMALKHAEYLVNHVPAKNHVCPMDLIQGSHIPRDHLRNLHVWGAPAYVLHPKLQDGSKIPKWDPRSRQGLHLGWSPLHASSVPLVLNLTTGHVSPQFHVVFDDWFTTVSTEERVLPKI